MQSLPLRCPTKNGTSCCNERPVWAGCPGSQEILVFVSQLLQANYCTSQQDVPQQTNVCRARHVAWGGEGSVRCSGSLECVGNTILNTLFCVLLAFYGLQDSVHGVAWGSTRVFRCWWQPYFFDCLVVLAGFSPWRCVEYAAEVIWPVVVATMFRATPICSVTWVLAPWCLQESVHDVSWGTVRSVGCWLLRQSYFAPQFCHWLARVWRGQSQKVSYPHLSLGKNEQTILLVWATSYSS